MARTDGKGTAAGGRRAVKKIQSGIVEAVHVAGEGVDAVRRRIVPTKKNRDNVVMVRVDDESLNRIDDLVDATELGSRSEAASYLISEGIRSLESLFADIRGTAEEIRKTRRAMQQMLQADRKEGA